jgi:uncharacterized protein with ParB-like and HNH nuclease domain
MNKTILDWTVETLQTNAQRIEFGEYQREPSVWNLKDKRRLIDSILRGYDISGIYLYQRAENRFECIDGRQRINAILSFLGTNVADDDGRLDNHFTFQSSDELLGKKELEEFEGKRFIRLSEDEKGRFFDDKERIRFLSYRPTIILLTDLEDEDDLHLMFLRLQLGDPLNAGEKLKAMKGRMRDFIFNELGKHPYFERLKIPQRRFSKEQTAAQVALQFFSKAENGNFHKARFEDLQTFFKQKSSLSPTDEGRLAEIIAITDRTDEFVEKHEGEIELKNRAMGVTLYFVLQEIQPYQVDDFFKFLKEFQKTVREQVKLGVFINRHFLSLLKFQTYITQAAVEKYAIEGRQKMLLDYFKEYLGTGEIKEDPVD